MPKVEYRGHKVSHNGLEVNRSALTDLAFPGSLRAMHCFIEDYAICASVLYELREIDFAAMMKDTSQVRIRQVLEAEIWIPRWIHPYRSVNVLKSKIATTQILLHFDPDRRATVVVYASDWAISGSLMQEYGKTYYPVIFASRTLKSNELNYGIAEKGVLALLTTLDLNYKALIRRPIHVLTRHSTLAWLFRSTAVQGRLGQWTALLSPWTLEITKCVKGEDEILGAFGGQSLVDKALISIAPKKEPTRKIQAPIPTIRRDEDLYVVSFDGSARVKRGGGATTRSCGSCLSGGISWVTVVFGSVERSGARCLVICGDSNLVIRRVRGGIDCKAPGLTLLRLRALDRLRTWPDD
ncbi:reverse transcriptase [Phytophthora megakarya]|uniref:Reverse transcriptase n=1 Tax=Phytophthora megakarya TaxID=4795 RepID=A0A225VEI0_9STRA|nr:reverse transcriptase [Phytophthora megakarya]